jgi:hypothetical protein
VRLGVASAALARASLAQLPAAAAAALDLRATAGQLACYVTAKSAEARAEAAAMSRHLAEAGGLAVWAAAVRAECKPAVARGLLAGLGVPEDSAAADEAAAAAAAPPAADAADAAAAAAAAAACPASPGRGGGGGCGAFAFPAGSPCGSGRVPSLAQYLRERSSQRRRRGGLLPDDAAAAAALGPALPPMGPFSPSALGVGRRSRASKSPVLVLKREQMLAGGGEAVAAGAIVEVEGEGC